MTGLLTCEEGHDWLQQREATLEKEFRPDSTEPLKTSQGTTVADVRHERGNTELGNKDDYFTVTSSIAEEHFNVDEEPTF